MSAPPQVRFSKIPSQGIVYGIDGVGFVGLVVVAVIASVAAIGTGALGLFTSAPITIPLAVISVWKIHGQSVLVHLLREVVGMARILTGGTKFRARPDTPKVTPESAIDLPGEPGRLHLYEASNGAVVVWDAVSQTATVSCLVASPGMGIPQAGAPSTVSADTRAGMIWEWAKVLGSFSQKPHLARVTILEQTRPGTVSNERHHFETHASAGNGGPLQAAADAYRQTLDLADASVVQCVTQISVSVKLTAEARQLAKAAGGGAAGLLAFAELEMDTLDEALEGCGFTQRTWMRPREWGAWARSIIDPAAQPGIDARIGGVWEGVDPQAATPMLVNDTRLHVETDSAWHRAHWIGEWPRYDTHPGFLSRLIFARTQDGTPVRHTFALVGAPVPIDKAMKQLEDEKKGWIVNAKLRQKTGKPDSAADEAEWHDIREHESDLVAGQGELRFSAYLVTTALSRDVLEREAASMINACAATGLEPRALPWQQWGAVATVAYPSGRALKNKRR